MLQACSREEFFCLLFLATGLQPTSRIPDLDSDKSKCLEALRAEYGRLGRPLAGLGYNGRQARELEDF